MKTVVVDTNVLIGFLAGEERLRHVFDGYGQILVPSVVVGEYLCGVDMKTTRGQRQKKALEAFLAKTCVVLVPIGEKEPNWYATLFRVLKKQGTPIPQNDLWIAATALASGSSLLTDDGHFKAIPLLHLI